MTAAETRKGRIWSLDRFARFSRNRQAQLWHRGC